MPPSRQLSILALVLLLTLALLPAEGKPSLVYDVGGATGREVITARGNGKGTRNRTEGTIQDAYLLPGSPNGRRMCWLELLGASGERGRLLIAKTRGGRGREVTWGLDGRPLTTAWAPDSRTLYFEHRDATTGRSDVYRVSAAGRKRVLLTAGLPGSASAEGQTATVVVGPSGVVAFSWVHLDRRTLLRHDTREPGALEDLAAELPPGELRGDPLFHPDGSLALAWFRFDLTETWLYERGATSLVVVEDDIERFAIRGGHLAVQHREEVVTGIFEEVVSHGGLRFFVHGSNVLAFRLAADGTVAVVYAPPGTDRVRIAVQGDSFLRELLPTEAIQEVEKLRFDRPGRHLLLRVVQGGSRMLYHVDVRSRETRRVAGGPGTALGAFAAMAPEGDVVLYTTLEPEKSSGRLIAWSKKDETSQDLTAASGVVGLPGSAVFSERTGDVLFNTRTETDSGNRLFLWRRRNGRVRAISPISRQVGTYFFSR